MAPTNLPPRSPWHPWVVVGVLLVGLTLRFHDLGGQSFWLDELWGLEITAGHGADHQALPVGTVLPSSPDLTSLGAAEPMWRVWTGMDRITGPPGAYLLLRAWVDLFGESEAAVRSLSAAASGAAVIMLFLALRRWSGPEPALWAAALMAVAGPQVHAARDGRPYAPLMLLGTATLWIVGRIICVGPTRRRGVALAGALLAMLLTHYFAVAAVVAVGAYGLCSARGSIRRTLVTAVVVAMVTFAIVWGPFAIRQFGAISHSDRAAQFLNESRSGHVSRTIVRAVSLPASLLVDRRPISLTHGVIGALIYAAALVLCIRRCWSSVWPLWFLMVVTLLVGLDLARHTRHLNYIRYPLLAGPAAYVAIAMLPTLHRQMGRVLATTAVVFATWNLPAVDVPPNADFRGLGDAVSAAVPAGQPIVFAGPAERYAPQILYLAVSHYAGPPRGPVMLLESPAVAGTLRSFPSTIWMVADPEVRLAREWLPGYHLTGGQSWPAVGSLLRMERDR